MKTAVNAVQTKRVSLPWCRQCRRVVCRQSGVRIGVSSSTYFQPVQRTAGLFVVRLGRKDENGYFTILGRTDDVINVAGHRLGTREIEEAVQNHKAIAEVAVVGVEDKLKGQVPIAFAVVKDAGVVATPDPIKALERSHGHG